MKIGVEKRPVIIYIIISKAQPKPFVHDLN